MSQRDNNAPFTIAGTPGQVITLTQPGAGGYRNQQVTPWVVLRNNSGVGLQWSVNTQQGTIQPWASDAISLGYGPGPNQAWTGPQVVTVVTQLPSSATSGSMDVIWSDDGDPWPGAYPSSAVQTIVSVTGGSALTLTDPNIPAGAAIPLVATLAANASGALPTLGAPVSAWYLFALDFTWVDTDSREEFFLQANGGIIARVMDPGGSGPGYDGSQSIDLNRFRATTAVTWSGSGGPADGFRSTLRYAPGP